MHQCVMSFEHLYNWLSGDSLRREGNSDRAGSTTGSPSERTTTLMSAPDYEYRGLMAASWDLGQGDTSHREDRVFFREIIGQFGQPALDVGCGTGRIILDYLSDGIDIDGLDNSPEMLAICREKARKVGLSARLYEPL